MSLAAEGKKMVVSRGRCESPAPRDATAAASFHSTHAGHCKDMQTSAPPLSVVAFLASLLLLGRAALLTDSDELLGDTPTCTALIVFLALGALVMRFDFVEFAKEEAQKKGVLFEPGGRRWLWLLVIPALLLAVAVAWAGVPAGFFAASPSTTPTGQVSAASPRAASLVRGEGRAVIDAASVKCIPTRATLRWRISVHLSDEVTIFLLSAALMIGLATSIIDLTEMSRAQQEANTGTQEDFSSSSSSDKVHKPTRSRSQWRLWACIALLLAVVVSFVASLVEDI